LSTPTPFSEKQPLSRAGLFHLAIVYVVWGSTYLAIRVGVREGSGFTPFMLGAMRVLAAGVILLVVARLGKQRLRLARREYVALAGSGLLLWWGGNGLVMLAEVHTDSGITALIIAGVPIWVMMIEALLDRKKPSLLAVGSLLLGFAGIALLSMPLLLSGVRADAFSVVVMLCASLCWSMGTVLQSRSRLQVTPTVASAYQLLAGGVGFVLTAMVLREPLPQPIPEAWLAWGYLVVFGSLIAFTSYIRVIQILPMRIVTTYSYVNPIIAVLLEIGRAHV
jgi:drug/metabolite transporter (DMT)-like permease